MRTYLEELSSWSDIQELFDIEEEEPLFVYAIMEHNQDEENISYIEVFISHDGNNIFRLFEEWYPEDYPTSYALWKYSLKELSRRARWDKGLEGWMLALSANDKIEDWM